tara:strand:- start:2925 stop:3659 length:735 start_codon:yes stop_codon:yes gene_type:complete
MNLPVYFVSDVHFQMTNSDREKLRRKKMYSLFEKIKISGGTLIIGGDFFDFWYDYGYYVPPEFKDVFEKLNELHESGIEIHYIAGNHDYWDFGYFNRTFGANFYKTDLEFSINNKNILITHGDGVLKKDKYYRILKKILRSKINILLFKLLPAKLGCELAKIVSKTTKHYDNNDNQNLEIISEIKEWAKPKLDIQYDTILIGHYHQNGIKKIKNKKLIFMGDWVTQFKVTEFDGKQWCQYTWNK